ncbi:hypothetical protein ACFL6M_03435 [Candidatus Eisenbacteria bacterium]|uniref:DUF2330 domain-containing protein n=1 Tax=Eiseniibacteriota bacterium TaxID=2212470 RepID=A0ABV6YJW4_UNCEI
MKISTALDCAASRAGALCLLGLVLLAALGSTARADGMFVSRLRHADIREPEQKALIYYHDGVEDLVLSVRYEGAPEDFGWIVPLPAVPELAAEDPERGVLGFADLQCARIPHLVGPLQEEG